jgi:hypothetical protein
MSNPHMRTNAHLHGLTLGRRYVEPITINGYSPEISAKAYDIIQKIDNLIIALKGE